MAISRFIIRLGLFLVVPIVAAFLAYQSLTSFFVKPFDPHNTTVRLFEIPPNKIFSQVADDLAEQKFVRHAWSVRMIARFGHKDLKLKPGEYELSESMAPRQILEKILSGDTFKRTIIIREGVTVNEIAALVEESGLVPAEEFRKVSTDRKLLDIANIRNDSFEGYLFPETYTFSRPLVAKDVVWKMLEEGDKNWPPEFTQRADELKRSRHEILTLASIIQKESPKPDDQPTISSVLHNRLTQGMPLQSDPTVIYGMKDFRGTLTQMDTQTPNPYNTYTLYGLPPGPICNPGKSAIHAALYPKETPYLYFVANGTGGHTFSTTLEEHSLARQALKELNEKIPGQHGEARAIGSGGN